MLLTAGLDGREDSGYVVESGPDGARLEPSGTDAVAATGVVLEFKFKLDEMLRLKIGVTVGCASLEAEEGISASSVHLREKCH